MVISETLSKDSSRRIITIKRRVLGKGGKQSRASKSIAVRLYTLQELPGTPYRATGAAIVLPNGDCFIGVSFYSTREEKPFNELKARDMAVGRAIQASVRRPQHPDMYVSDNDDHLWDGANELAIKYAILQSIVVRRQEIGKPSMMQATSPMWLTMSQNVRDFKKANHSLTTKTYKEYKASERPAANPDNDARI